MKKLLLLSTLFILFAAQISWGQVSKTIEGLAIDSKGIPLPDGDKDITFNIYDSSDGDVLLWSEQQTVAIKDGRFAATLGQVNALDDLLEDTTYWLTMKVGQGKELKPRFELNLHENDETTTRQSALVGNTLDLAYDEGGAGAGRTITADAGAVHILGSDGAVPSFPAIGGKDFLVSENNGNSNVSIIGGATNSSALKFFPSGATGNVGVLNYNFANDQMSFGTVNGSTRMTIDAANGVGIGTVAPNGQLGLAQVAGTNRWLDILGDSNEEVSISIQPQNTNTTALARGLSIVPVMKASTAGTAGYGVQIDTQPQANLNGFSYGTLAIAQLSNSSSNVTNYFPMYFRFDTQSTYSGAIDTVDVFRIDTPVLDGSKPGNIAGLNIANQGGTGTTNAYGLRILGQSGATNNWNVYSEGTNSTNFFEGNVGIGTDNPGEKLEVAGTIHSTSGGFKFPDGTLQATAASGGGGSSIADADNDTEVETEAFPDDDRIRLVTAGIQRMIVNETGNIGIGTNIPGANLEVGGDVVLNSDLDVANGALHVDSATGRVGTGLTSPSAKMHIEQIANTDAFRVDDQAGDTTPFVIDANGRVAIGTTSTFHTLEIAGDIKIVDGTEGLGKVLTSDLSGGASWQTVGTGSQIKDANGDTKVQTEETANENKIRFDIAGTERMIIDEFGDVGLGLSSPVAKLHIEHTTNANAFRVDDQAGDTTPFVIDPNGRVGIGIASPLHALEIGGDIKIVDGSQGAGKVLTSDANGSASWQTPGTGSQIKDANNDTKVQTEETADENKIRFDTGGTERMIIDEFGDLGLGLTSPSAKMHIEQTTNSAALRVDDQTGDTTPFVVDANGRVGIGTANPLTALEISGDIKIVDGNQGAGKILTSDASGGGSWQTLTVSTIQDGAGDTKVEVDNIDNIHFETFGSEHMIINSSGQIGIGTSTPGMKFHVVGNTRMNGDVEVDTTTFFVDASSNSVGIGTKTPIAALDVIGQIRMNDGNQAAGKVLTSDNSGTASWQENIAATSIRDTDNDTRIETERTPDDDKIFFRTAGFDRMVMDDAGDLGLGAGNPTAQLHTTGTVRFAGFGAGTLQTDANGNVSVSSDVRLKNVNSSFDRGLAEVRQLQPIIYTWKEKTGLDTKKTYVGFSAQNVGKVIPEAVMTDNNGYLTLSDRPIIAALVNAVKELKVENEDLMAKNQISKTENDELKHELQIVKSNMKRFELALQKLAAASNNGIVTASLNANN